jgi:hypothetical protein
MVSLTHDICIIGVDIALVADHTAIAEIELPIASGVPMRMLKERSFEIASVENSHRVDRLDRVLSNQVLLSRLGLILGGVITLFVVGIGALLALQGKDLSNFSKIVVAAGVPAGVFIRGYQANQPNSPKR